MAVAVQTANGVYSLIGDLMLMRESLQPNKEKGWPLTPPVGSTTLLKYGTAWKSVIRRSDYILMTHDREQLGHEIYP